MKMNKKNKDKIMKKITTLILNDYFLKKNPKKQ